MATWVGVGSKLCNNVSQHGNGAKLRIIFETGKTQQCFVVKAWTAKGVIWNYLLGRWGDYYPPHR